MVQDLDISKTNATERMRSLIASANSLKINSHVPLNRYYRSMIEMHRMAHLYLESNNFEKALVLLVRFCSFTIEQLPNHANYGLYDSEEKRNVLELLNPALEKAEEIKQQLRKIYDEEANEFNRLFLIHQKEQVGAGRTSRVLVEAGQLVPVDDTSLNTNHSAPISLPITNPDVSTVEILFSGLKVSPSSITASGPVATSVFLDNNKPSINSGGTILGQNAVKHSEKNMTIAGDLIEKFMQFTVENTSRNIETCGILCGKMVNDNFIVSHVIIPKQKGSANGCTAENEEEVFHLQDEKSLITLGWIHTHPSQTAFLSSIDLHTHCAYQTMMNEAIAIVCAPTHNQVGIFVLTPYGMSVIGNCDLTGFHPHNDSESLFQEAQHVKYCNEFQSTIIDLRL